MSRLASSRSWLISAERYHLRNSSYDGAMSVDRSAQFVGTPQRCRQQAGFSFGHWVAQTGDDVREHVHIEPHFMFIAGGRFVTSAGSGRSPLIYNPPNTVHRDHFESPSGRFFAVSAA